MLLQHRLQHNMPPPGHPPPSRYTPASPSPLIGQAHEPSDACRVLPLPSPPLPRLVARHRGNPPPCAAGRGRDRWDAAQRLNSPNSLTCSAAAASAWPGPLPPPPVGTSVPCLRRYWAVRTQGPGMCLFARRRLLNHRHSRFLSQTRRHHPPPGPSASTGRVRARLSRVSRAPTSRGPMVGRGTGQGHCAVASRLLRHRLDLCNPRRETC